MSLVSAVLQHPANQGSRLTALTRMAFWQAFKRLTGKAICIPYHGMKLRCHPKSHSASGAIYFSGLPDFREMLFMLEYLRPGDLFIDAGANIGLYTLLARSVVGEEGHVHAFEPNPDTVSLLWENLNLNQIQNVSVHQLGLSDSAGKVGFNPTADACTSHVDTMAKSETVDLFINSARLDETLPWAPYAMVKLDIEGYEPFAIRGASRWLDRGTPPVLQIEIAGYSNRYGVTSANIIDELDSYGYFTAIYEPETRSLQQTNRPWDLPVDNVLAVSREHESFVSNRLSRRNKDKQR
ncbi:MAG: FkbM family methyltransferase [bacterium]